MSTMAQIVANGIGPSTCLRVWGEARLRNHGLLPDAWGWPSEGIEHRLMEQGHGAKEPGKQPLLTSPERAVDSLENARAIAHWTQNMLAECTPKQRVAVFLRYVRGKCYEDIAKQMTEGDPVTSDDVSKWLEAARLRIKRGLQSVAGGNREAAYC